MNVVAEKRFEGVWIERLRIEVAVLIGEESKGPGTIEGVEKVSLPQRIFQRRESAISGDMISDRLDRLDVVATSEESGKEEKEGEETRS